MTIEIHQPELESLIEQRLESGAFENVEDLLREALKAYHPPPKVQTPAHPANDLVELFANSPFAGMNIEFERDRDTGRDVEL